MAAKDPACGSKVVLDALLRLRAAGDKSFERLVADLLTDLTGMPFRLSRAGDQRGVDALSAEGVGLEMKRYQEGTALKERELLGELHQATNSKRDLQVWGLTTTGEVPAQLHDQLSAAATGLGVSLLILDRSTGHPLPVSAIVALVAVSPSRLLRALEDPEWLDPTHGAPLPIEKVAKALEAVRRLPAFGEWSASLKARIDGLPTWDRIRRDQNRRLKMRLLSYAEEFFGTVFDLDAAVPREAEEKIDAWFETARCREEPSVAVVLGERYDGKTWMVYHWLIQNLAELPLPVFLFGAKEGDGQDRLLKKMIVQEIADLLEIEHQRAWKILVRFGSVAAGVGPWALVILDGLNEYRVDPEHPFQHLAHAAAQRTDLNHRSCAVLTTARSHWWHEHEDRIKQTITRIEVGAYSDPELEVALVRCGQDLSILATVQGSARDLIRRPRYLQLVLDHRDRLDQFGAITADVLHYLDAFDKMRSRGYIASGTGWDHQAYSEALSGFARTFLEEAQLGSLWERREIHKILGELVSDPQTALRDLESEGVVTKSEGGYIVSPERLITGVGLWLHKALKSAAREGRNVKEELIDLLEPMKDVDEKVAWLKAAAVFGLLKADAGTDKGDEEVLDALVDQWLRSRNLGKLDVQDAEALRARLLPSLIRLAPRAWSERCGDPRLQEFSLLVFGDGALRSDQYRCRDLLQVAARDWCKLVPKTGTRFLRAEDPEVEIQKRLQAPEVASLGLKLAHDRGALKLQRAALYLESLSPGLLDADAVLAVVAIEQIAPNPLDEAERRLARGVLADIPREWFENHVLAGKGRAEIWRSICHQLLRLADRADLEDLKESVAPPPDPERERLLRQWQPTIEDHLRVAQTLPAHDEDVLRFTERSRFLVLDPEHPHPVKERLEALTAQTRSEFEGVRLQASSMSTADDHRFRDLVPGLAAWLPGVGVEVVVNQIIDLPRRFQTAEEDAEATYYTWLLDRHSVLLAGALRRRLHSILAPFYPDDRRRFDAAMVFLALLPGMTAPQRLDAILGHSLLWDGKAFEWRRIYELAAFLADPKFMEVLRVRLDIEEDPLKLERLRLLAVEIGGIGLSDAQARRIERDLTALDSGVRFAAVAAGAEGKMTDLPAAALLQLVCEEDHRASMTPRYAAWLLVQKGECLDELPIYWQAVAAAQHPGRRESFLREVERALHASLWSSDNIRDPLANVLVRATPSDPVEHQIGVSDYASDSTLYFYTEDPGIGGLEELDDAKEEWDPFGARDRIVEKRNRLAREAAEHFKSHARNHERVWESEIFPQELVDSLEAHRFAAWAKLLLSAGPTAEAFWTGLLQPMFRRALREGGDLARGLFFQCFPFARRTPSRSVRFVDRGLHWTLHHLADPSMDDRTARELLRELVLDTRSDLELFEVALAARLGDPARLGGLVEEWLHAPDIEIRSRGVRLAGWLTDFGSRLEALHQNDPSLYVRRIAGDAIASMNRERWAQHWIRLFLSNESLERRWGAGQLFLACTDRRIECWTGDELAEVTRTRTRGEAFLLLEAARKEIKDLDRSLRDSFLGVKVRDLENLCHPWRPQSAWRRLEPRA